MKKCPNCDADIEELRNACPFCGTFFEDKKEKPQTDQRFNYGEAYSRPKNTHVSQSDSGSTGFWVLGFFFPIVGLILYFVWRNEQPKNASKCLWGAITSFICTFVFFILTIICSIIGIMSSGGM